MRSFGYFSPSPLSPTNQRTTTTTPPIKNTTTSTTRPGKYVFACKQLFITNLGDSKSYNLKVSTLLRTSLLSPLSSPLLVSFIHSLFVRFNVDWQTVGLRSVRQSSLHVSSSAANALIAFVIRADRPETSRVLTCEASRCWKVET